jgi:hypothetical protein
VKFRILLDTPQPDALDMPPAWERRSRRWRGIGQVTFGVSILFFVAWTTVVHPTTNVRAVLDAAFLADGRLPVVATEVACLSIAVGLVPTGLTAAMVAGSSIGAELSNSSAHAL